jgi:hypothetical protein
MSRRDKLTIQEKRMKLLSKGNSKLHKGIATWSITAGKEVCGRECKGCYALKEQKRWASVRNGREVRYALSLSPKFAEVITKELDKHLGKYIRVHASGEFYSQEYVNKWAKIAKANPDKVFYAYTKRDFDFTELEGLSNFVLHRSFVEYNGKKVANYGKAEEMSKIAEATVDLSAPLQQTGQVSAAALALGVWKKRMRVHQFSLKNIKALDVTA